MSNFKAKKNHTYYSMPSKHRNFELKYSSVDYFVVMMRYIKPFKWYEFIKKRTKLETSVFISTNTFGKSNDEIREELLQKLNLEIDQANFQEERDEIALLQKSKKKTKRLGVYNKYTIQISDSMTESERIDFLCYLTCRKHIISAEYESEQSLTIHTSWHIKNQDVAEIIDKYNNSIRN
ncbi:MAG: hypothetical protein F6K08_18470 [Okeania sp. SIO1H6]|nr:hypothetical protein [Okeania sp. SIO1H6]